MGKCASCGEALTNHRRYDFKTPVFRKLYSETHVYRCEACTLSQADVEAVAEDRLSDYYARDYRVVAGTGAISPVTMALWEQRSEALVRLAKLHGTIEPKRIFEVGAGYGVNLLTMAKAFPDAELLTDEVSQTIERAFSIKRAQLSDGPFDIIILSHVLEHFTDPMALLGRVREALIPGGLVLIEVPNDIDGIERYNGPDEPHLIFFELETLRFMLNRSRLNLIDIFAAGPSVKHRTAKARLKQAIWKTLYALPITSSFMKRRAVGRIGKQDFSERNPNGTFLRAVLTR